VCTASVQAEVFYAINSQEEVVLIYILKINANMTQVLQNVIA
jgi:hypothetical protein